MKILVAHNHYQQPGGEDESFAAEVAALREAGVDVTTHAVHNDAINSMSKLTVARKTVWNRDSYREIGDIIRRVRPDVAHFQNTFPLISPAAYYAAKAEGVPVVQHLRNYRLICPGAVLFRDGKICEECLNKTVPVGCIAKGCYRGSPAATATVAAMLAFHRARGTYDRMVDLYVSLTEFARQKYIQGGFAAEKIVVKPNFVTPDPGPGPGPAPGGERFAVFLGRLSPEKGVGTMIRAWEEFGLAGEIGLKVIGSGPVAHEVEAAAGRTAGIEYVGRRPPREAYEIVGRASVLLLPSEWYEPFGRVAVEAFAKGTPVIACDLGAMPELIDDGRTGLLFKPGDPLDLAMKVRQLLADPARLAAMRAEVRREFEAKYTARQNVRQLLDIYQRVIDANGVPTPAAHPPAAPAAGTHAS